MTNFVLIYTGGTYPETEEEQAKMMAAWGAWYGKMGDKIVDGGNPFSASKQVTRGGVNDSAPGSLTGYTIISADSLDAAVEQCKDHPHLNYGGGVSVYETMKLPEM